MTMTYKDFVEKDQTVFGRYAKLEEEQQRDIPDSIKNLELVGRVFPGLTLPKRKAIAGEADTAFWDEVAKNHRLRKEAKSVLRQLATMGLRMAVISNHHHAEGLKKHLGSLGISSYFSQVIVSSEFPYRKPDPRIFRKCTTLLKVNASQSVFVGDSPANDVTGAKRAGMTSILIADQDDIFSGSPTAEPDFTVRELDEIPRIIKSLNHQA